MAEAGVLPRALACIQRRTEVPLVATGVVLVVAAVFVSLGDLAYVASLTDAAVLTSFAMVNVALVWLAFQARIPRRAADIAVPLLAASLCALFIAHTGFAGIAMAALAGLGVVIGVAIRRTER